jgi:uncharacterized protein involved in exopolysaccharide biosynthesis
MAEDKKPDEDAFRKKLKGLNRKAEDLHDVIEEDLDNLKKEYQGILDQIIPLTTKLREVEDKMDALKKDIHDHRLVIAKTVADQDKK